EIKVREYLTKQIKTDIGLGQEPSSLGEGAPPASILELGLNWQPGPISKTASRIEFGANLAVRLDENITFPNLNYNITWFTPWIVGFRLPIRMKYYHDEQLDEKIDGISSSFIYRTGERYKLSGSVNLEYIESNIESDQKRSIQLNYIEQKLDDFIYPSSGYFYSVNTELNGTFLGGEVHYFKLDLEYKKFYPLDKNITFGVHHRAGYLHSINYRNENTSQLPSFYKFKLGGNTSLRGWRDTDDINPDGGMIRFQSNLEFRYPIIWLIGGELFLDMGKLADNFDGSIFKRWNWDIGTGLTVNTPIGPVRTDIAFPEGNWSEPMVLLSILYLF
ncbi:MAG: BamA/TamA family outer membrane protein, partial [Fidelibacterota bacterium]